MKHTLVFILMFMLVGCAPKLNSTFVLPIPTTYDEEKRVATSYPIVEVYIEELNDAKAN